MKDLNPYMTTTMTDNNLHSITYNFLFFFCQLGGTVGDIEGMPFIEAFRQFQFRVGRDNFCVVHVSLIPEVIYLLF